jgi:3-phenylpropionate/trans-cinnamate dioxygenase ferredoxin reductase subunit
MARTRTFVIVGAGLAGAKAAEALRDDGFDGRIVLIGAELVAPYERPPLSKGYLRGESPLEKAFVQGPSFWGARDIELLTGTTAVAVNCPAHEVTLADGTRLSFDRLLLATGSVPRRPPVPGVDLDGIHTFRSLADADRLRHVLERGGPLVLIGAGWIGCEVGASARQLGAEVTIVDREEAPLARVLGPEIGNWFADLHRSHGVRLKLGAGVERFEGGRTVERVRLTDGRSIEAAAVVLGVGIVPDAGLAQNAGLWVQDGVVVDELLATSEPDVFAAGDVASAWHPRYRRRIRVEHWSAALNQGIAAGRSMLGRREPYARLPYFFSDQYDAGMEYVGLHSPSDRLVIRGSLDDASFQAFWLDAHDRVTAAMHVNDWDSIDAIKGLVERGHAVDPPALADPDGTLAQVAAKTEAGSGARAA